ncbi:MAG TPA: hypothetical protein VMC42_08720 [Methanoregulaceae archaeon]|nr:hypothetical protein [Methanoregulaceae archaeon]
MKRDYLKMTFIAGVIIIAGILFFALLVSETPGKTGTGCLRGSVTIGPLCPVEPCHISEEQRTAVYAARHLDVSGPGFSGLVPKTSFAPEDVYQIALPARGYDVSLPKNGIDRNPDLPRHIVVMPGETTILNVSIDTGIR